MWIIENFFVMHKHLNRLAKHMTTHNSASYNTLSCCFFFFTFYKVAAAAAAKSLQSCTTLCDPIDGGPPGSPIPGILQARTLE